MHPMHGWMHVQRIPYRRERHRVDARPRTPTHARSHRGRAAARRALPCPRPPAPASLDHRHISMASAAMMELDVGSIEPDALVKSGSRRRAVLAANPATCDIYVHGFDRRLRMYNPKVASDQLRCVQLLRPQLLSDAFVQSVPGFWKDPPHVQEQHVRKAFGGDPAALDLLHEVVELKLHEAGRLLAMVELDSTKELLHVSVAVLPPAARVPAPPDEVGGLLARLGLGQYAAAMRQRGYVRVQALMGMSAAEREAMAADPEIDMSPGHAHTLAMCRPPHLTHLDLRPSSKSTRPSTGPLAHSTRPRPQSTRPLPFSPANAPRHPGRYLEGRLPAPLAAPAAVAEEDPAASCWAVAIPPLSHFPAPAPSSAPAATLVGGTPVETPAGATRRMSFSTATGGPATAPGGRGFSLSLSAKSLKPDPSVACTPASVGTPAAADGSGRRSPPVSGGRLSLGGGAGSSVVQVEWHPMGEAHLAVLRADGSFALYDVVSDLSTPVLAVAVPADVVGFGFGGASHHSWASLTTFFLSATGEVYLVCPLFPPGRRARRHLAAAASALEASASAGGAGDAAAWLKRQLASGSAAAPAPPPRVQGPFQVLDVEGAAFPAEAGVSALTLGTIPLAGGLVGVLLGCTDQTVGIGLSTAEPMPVWEGDEERAAATPIEIVHVSTAKLGGAAGGSAGGGTPTRPPTQSLEKLEWMRIAVDASSSASSSARIFVHSSAGGSHLLDVPFLWQWSRHLASAGGEAGAGGPPPTPPRATVRSAATFGGHFRRALFAGRRPAPWTDGGGRSLAGRTRRVAAARDLAHRGRGRARRASRPVPRRRALPRAQPRAVRTRPARGDVARGGRGLSLGGGEPRPRGAQREPHDLTRRDGAPPAKRRGCRDGGAGGGPRVAIRVGRRHTPRSEPREPRVTTRLTR